MRLRLLVTSALFVAITAVCSLIAIPNPLVPVPFTLQVLAVCLTGLLLPWRWALASLVVYLALGAAGLPVFASGSGGLGPLFGVTGGFLWAFPVAALVAALAAGRRPGLLRLVLAGVAAILVIYVGGLAGMVGMGHLPLSWKTAAGLGLFLPWDLLKAVLAALLAVRLRRALPWPAAA